MGSDGYSLDDKRNKTEDSDIPDIIEKWKTRDKNKKPKKSDKWLWVDIKDIKENNYDLSISRYKTIEYEEIKYEKPEKIIERVLKLEEEIIKDLKSIEI
jgi:type I restriction enzyme M protein